MDEDSILRAQHPLYDAFCSEDEPYVDEMYEAESKWELQDGR